MGHRLLSFVKTCKRLTLTWDLSRATRNQATKSTSLRQTLQKTLSWSKLQTLFCRRKSCRGQTSHLVPTTFTQTCIMCSLVLKRCRALLRSIGVTATQARICPSQSSSKRMVDLQVLNSVRWVWIILPRLKASLSTSLKSKSTVMTLKNTKLSFKLQTSQPIPMPTELTLCRLLRWRPKA